MEVVESKGFGLGKGSNRRVSLVEADIGRSGVLEAAEGTIHSLEFVAVILAMRVVQEADMLEGALEMTVSELILHCFG